MAPPQPVKRAAPDSFDIRSFVVNGSEITGTDTDKLIAVEVATGKPFNVEGKIDFLKGQPFPPKVMLGIATERGEGERPVTHDTEFTKLGGKTAQGTPFSTTLKAPAEPGKYKLWLTAQPPKPARKQPQSDADRDPRVYIELELNVVAGK